SILNLIGCSGGGGNGSSSSGGGGGTLPVTALGTMSFNRTSVTLGQNSSTVVTLSLNNSIGVSNAIVTLTSSNTSIATVSPASCTLSSLPVSSNSCKVTIKSLTNNGSASILAASSVNGLPYVITPISVSVSGGSTLNFGVQVKGISQTIYTGQNYNAQFISTNNSGSAVTLANTVITATGNALPSALSPAPCSNVTIPANGTCTIVGNGINLPANTQLTDLNFTLTSTSGSVYSYDMSIGAVTNYPGFAAYRIINTQNPGHQGWLVALGNNGSGQAVVQFNSLGQGSLLPQSASYAQGQIAIPSTPFGLVVYQPNYQGGAGNGIGGLMYVSLDNPVFEPAGNIGVATTNPSDPNVNINYSVYEPNVYNDANNRLLANLDVTAINFYGVMQGFYATDITTGINKNPGFLVSTYANLSTSTIYSQIQNTLSSLYPSNWGSSAQFTFNTTN